MKWRAMLFTATPAGPGCRLWESSRFRTPIVTGEALPAEERQTGFTNMMRVALETAVL